MTYDECFNCYVAELKRYPLREAQYEKLAKKAEKTLKLYHEHIVSQELVPFKIEHRIPYLQYGGATINGRIDRIDFTDSTKRWVSLNDYKTGGSIGQYDLKRKPGKYLKKEDKGQRYYNQLMFYKVLSDIDPYFSAKGVEAVQGKLIFVDPDKEMFIERVVEYNRDNVEEMKALIIQVWQSIQNLEFPRVHGKGESCEFCELGV